MLPNALPIDVATTRRLTVLGNIPVLTVSDFDPNQLWMPFIHGIIKVTPQPRAPKTIPTRREDVAMMVMNPSAKVGTQYKRMYQPLRGVEQRVLPFNEHRQVSGKDMKLLEQAGWPCFEKDADGKVAIFHYDNQAKMGNGEKYAKRLEAWCEEHCLKRFYVGVTWAAFESWLEASMARMSI